MIVDSFEGQRGDEDILAVWRQHPWVLVRPAVFVILILAIVSIPMALSASWGLDFLLFAGAIDLLYGVSRFYLWFNTIYILTNQRIFAIIQSHLLVRTNNEVPLVNIQNVSHTKKGLAQMMFDFGEVEIETSGAKTAMRLKNVEKPYQAQQRILAK